MAIRLPKIGGMGLLGAAGAVGAAQWAASELGGPLAMGAKDMLRGDEKARTTGAALMEVQAQQQAEEMKRQQLAFLVESNQRRLAQWSPELYNQVLAGRRLPRGAVMIGGVPRTDLLAQVAMRMALGNGMEG